MIDGPMIYSRAQDDANHEARAKNIAVAPVRFGTIVWAIVVGNLISGVIAAFAFAILGTRK